jgi:hypothetical protein
MIICMVDATKGVGWAKECARQMASATRLGIPIFVSDFWDPHWKQNSDSVFDSGYTVRIFF